MSPEESVTFREASLAGYPSLTNVPVDTVWSTPVKETEPPPSSANPDGMPVTDTVFAPTAGLARPQITALLKPPVVCTPPSFVMATPSYETETPASESVLSHPERPTVRYRSEPPVVCDQEPPI